MDHLIGLAKPDTSFFEHFFKEQLSVINSRGVSLIPQLMRIRTAGPWSTVPYFTCFKGYSFALNYLIFARKWAKVMAPTSYRHNENDTLNWNNTTCMLLWLLLPLSSAVLFLTRNEPPLSTLVSAWRWHHSYSYAGSLGETCSASLEPTIGRV